MSKPHKMPLIGYLLWRSTDCGQLNGRIKKILELFVVCVVIGMPQVKIDVMAVSLD